MAEKLSIPLTIQEPGYKSTNFPSPPNPSAGRGSGLRSSSLRGDATRPPRALPYKKFINFYSGFLNSDGYIPELSKFSHAEKDALILSILARLELFELIVRKDSHNSDKPPSSDDLAKKTHLLGESPDKKVGGQIGRKGTMLKRVAEPTDVVNHTHCQCTVLVLFLRYLLLFFYRLVFIKMR